MQAEGNWLIMPILTLTTDFGLADNYVGVMKGALLGILPSLQIVDLTHQIAPQDVRQASHVLASAIPYFPPGTTHLVVVDPGVGSDRRPIAIQTARATYVGPDNGVLSPALSDPSATTWVLDEPSYWLPHPSRTFHGRDIFAPCAAHLASGISPARLGHRIGDPIRLQAQTAVRLGDAHVEGHVVSIDHFGNLITDIPAEWIVEQGWVCHLANQEIARFIGTYAEVPPGEPAVLAGSSGHLEIAVRNESAARRFGASIGTDVVITRGVLFT